MDIYPDIPRGQLSTVILSCLVDGDKYGYEIINEIELKSNGKIVIKQPSLYSSLKRMEDQELISSYWMDSDIGGRRHYYRLTDYGRKQVAKWQDDLLKTQNTVSSLFDEGSNKTVHDDGKIIENTEKLEEVNTQSDSSYTLLQQESLFNSASEDISKNEEEKQEQPKQNSFIQYNLFDRPQSITQPSFNDEPVTPLKQPETPVYLNEKFSTNESNNVSSNTQTNENKQDDGVLLDNKETISPVNNKKYDIYSEFSQFRKATKSYANAVKTSESKPSFDYKSSTLEDFMKDSFVMDKHETTQLDLRNFNDEKEINEDISNILDSLTTPVDDIVEKEDKPNTYIKNETGFITESYAETNLPKTRKIAPPNIDVFKLDTPNIDLSSKKPQQQNYKEVIGSLYNKSIALNTNTSGEENKNFVKNYNSLQNEFSQHNIYFKQYEKDRKSNNSIGLINDFKFSLIKFSFVILSLILSITITYLFIHKLSYIRNGQLWLYIVPIIVFFAVGLYFIVKKSKDKNKKILAIETNKFNLLIRSVVTIIALIICYALNVCFGLNSFNFNDYTTTLIVPVIYLLHIPLGILYTYLAKIITFKL